MKYPSEPVLVKKADYWGKHATVNLTKFANGNIPALFITEEATGELYTVCNVNPWDNDLEDYEFAIKNYSENQGMLTWLIENGLMKEPHRYIPSGFVLLPVCYASDSLKKFIDDLQSELPDEE